MKPAIDLEEVNASYSRTTKRDDMRINCSFMIENKGKSKTKNLKLYSCFLKWDIDKTNVTVSPYDFTYTDIADIVGGDLAESNIYKDIDEDTFINYTNLAQGLYMLVILRWQSDNICYLGRTFENYILLFFLPAIRDDKMVFQVREVEQKNITCWFVDDLTKPDISEITKELDAKRLIYGDVSRFD
jgi:hypothetical protein